MGYGYLNWKYVTVGPGGINSVIIDISINFTESRIYDVHNGFVFLLLYRQYAYNLD